ncbi:MAG: Bug family tripartite tricarboxylate transporter substrate binding protein [Burkholderiales bacterium]
MLRKAGLMLLCGCALTATGAAWAQVKYPERPIRLVAPFPPGGSVDVTARLVGPKMSESIGQQVIIDNRSGASGIVGTSAVARAEPDGYTILINTTPMVTNTQMYKKVPYDLKRDFEPVILLSSTPSVLSVHPSIPVRSIQDMIKLAKARPGELNYGGAGVGTNPHIAGELFNLLAGTNIVAVQFKGGGPALVGALSGEVGVSFSAVAGAVGYMKSNRLRPLGVTSLKPVKALPTVPTIASVLPGYEFTAWFAVVAPKGTKPDIINKLNAEFSKAMSSPDFVKRFEAEGLEVIGSTPAQLAAHLDAELKKWERVIKERKMRAD